MAFTLSPRRADAPPRRGAPSTQAASFAVGRGAAPRRPRIRARAAPWRRRSRPSRGATLRWRAAASSRAGRRRARGGRGQTSERMRRASRGAPPARRTRRGATPQIEPTREHRAPEHVAVAPRPPRRAPRANGFRRVRAARDARLEARRLGLKFSMVLAPRPTRRRRSRPCPRPGSARRGAGRRGAVAPRRSAAPSFATEDRRTWLLRRLPGRLHRRLGAGAHRRPPRAGPRRGRRAAARGGAGVRSPDAARAPRGRGRRRRCSKPCHREARELRPRLHGGAAVGQPPSAPPKRPTNALASCSRS